MPQTYVRARSCFHTPISNFRLSRLNSPNSSIKRRVDTYATQLRFWTADRRKSLEKLKTTKQPKVGATHHNSSTLVLHFFPFNDPVFSERKSTFQLVRIWNQPSRKVGRSKKVRCCRLQQRAALNPYSNRLYQLWWKIKVPQYLCAEEPPQQLLLILRYVHRRQLWKKKKSYSAIFSQLSQN